MAKLKPTPIRFEQDQRDGLEQLSADTGASVGELVRRAVATLLRDVGRRPVPRKAKKRS